jgi:hypothetical protein
MYNERDELWSSAKLGRARRLGTNCDVEVILNVFASALTKAGGFPGMAFSAVAGCSSA